MFSSQRLRAIGILVLFVLVITWGISRVNRLVDETQTITTTGTQASELSIQTLDPEQIIRSVQTEVIVNDPEGEGIKTDPSDITNNKVYDLGFDTDFQLTVEVSGLSSTPALMQLYGNRFNGDTAGSGNLLIALSEETVQVQLFTQVGAKVFVESALTLPPQDQTVLEVFYNQTDGTLIVSINEEPVFEQEDFPLFQNIEFLTWNAGGQFTIERASLTATALNGISAVIIE